MGSESAARRWPRTSLAGAATTASTLRYVVLAVSVADYVYASRVGKFTVWAELLQSLDLRGDERATPSSRLADRVESDRRYAKPAIRG
jgi:hypothetical protein